MPTVRFQAHGAFARYAGAAIPDGVTDGQCAEVSASEAAYLLATFPEHFTLADDARVVHKAAMDAPEASAVVAPPARRGKAK